MEFVEGETLAALLRRSGCLETYLALEIIGQVAVGLAAIEKQHLVHRDIKPSNIMVSLQDGKLENVKIIDLGLAKGVAEENTLFSILLSRLQGEQFNANDSFIETRQRVNEKVLKSPGNAIVLSQLAAVDALLNYKETAISEGNAAVEMAPIFKDAIDGPDILANLAVVYAWAGELDLAFATLEPLKKTPSFIGYGDFKCDSLWTPLRKDPRFDKLLAELAPHD
jgi:serine/threonine protein kinase